MTNSGIPNSEAPARPWLSADAQRWAAARRPRWARPAWPAALLVVTVIAAMAMSPGTSCTAQAPCGEEWLDAVGTMLLLPHLLSLFVLPELAVVTAPLLLVYVALPGQWQGGIGEKAADGAVAAALCWSWMAVVARLRARRHQRTLIKEAAGGIAAHAPMPGGIQLGWRGLIRWIAGVLMCGAATGLIASVVADDRSDDRTARAAQVHELPVVAYSADDDVLSVRMPDGSRHRFDVTGSYQGDDTERVLVHGDWARLASEPYRNHFVFQAAALALAGLGITSIASGLLSRRRTIALRRGPVLVLGAQARSRAGVTEVFAADDADGLRPVLHYTPYPDTPTWMRQVVLYGSAGEGGTILLSGPSDTGSQLTEVSLSPVRLGAAALHDTARKTGIAPVDNLVRRRDTRHDEAAEIRAQQAVTVMIPAHGPVVWQAGPVARCTGAVMLIAAVVALTVLTADSVTWWKPDWTWAVGLMWLDLARRIATWKITADADGLHVRILWPTRSIPWQSITGARYTRQGELSIRRGNGLDDLRVGSIGSPSTERLLRRPGRSTKAAAQITAMAREPGLRPTRPS